jgi:hypothetical protein
MIDVEKNNLPEFLLIEFVRSRLVVLFQRLVHTLWDLARTSVVSGAIVLGCFLPALSLIIVSNLLPSDVIKRNVLSSLSPNNKEQNSMFPNLKLDHFTECIFVTTGMRSKSLADRSDSSLKRAFIDAVTSPTLGNCEQITASGNSGWDYFRYWHGAQIIVKPILLVTTVSVLRAIVFAVFIFTSILLVITIGVRVSWLTSVVVAIIISFSPLYSQLFLITHASSWIIGFVGATLILRSRCFSFDAKVVHLVIVGVLVAYFDLFNNPIVAPTAVLFAITLVRWRDEKGADFREAALCLAAWFMGYGGLWVLKWAAAAAVLGIRPVSDDVFDQIFYRLSGQVRWLEEDVSTWNSVSENFLLVAHVVFVSIVLSLLVAAPSLRRGWREVALRAVTSWKLSFQMLGIGLIPAVWIAIVQSHSLAHKWFVAPVLCWTMMSLPISIQILVGTPARKAANQPSAVRVSSAAPFGSATKKLGLRTDATPPTIFDH